MNEIEREDIQIISQNSNWSEKSIDKILKKEIYNDKKSWEKFLKLLFISLGVGFTTAGILFFFAYNWADLHKFVKIGLVESLILIITLIILLSKINLEVKNVLLTGASILVGVLFAVFGQIYQTGANAYDFFLSWTIFITLWVIFSNFAPLWGIFITLINTTIILYSEQVAYEWSEVFVFTLLFVVNILFLVIALFDKKRTKKDKFPIWFTNLIALTSISFSTIGISIGVFEQQQASFFILLIITSIMYIIGIKYGLKVKSSFYLSTISFSIIIIIATFIIRLTSDFDGFYISSLFVVLSITFLIKTLMNLKKNGRIK